MKIPEEPPDHQVIAFKDPRAFFAAMAKPEAQVLLRKMLREYPYWDKLKYWPMPPGVTPEYAWSFREWTSSAKRTYIPLINTAGKRFSFWLPDSAQEWLYQIERNTPAQLLLEEGSPSAQARDRYIASSLMEEAIASSQIEGAAVTRRVAKEMLRSGRAPVNTAERMILNNYRAIEKLRVLKDKPLSLEVLHELHAILTEGTLEEPDAAGRLRRSPEDDDVHVIDDGADPHILHSPPKGSELSARLEEFFAFANDRDPEPFIHPVIKAILLHFWIGYDHPYIDGNGRVARAVFYWYLLKKGYWIFEFVSLSRMVLKASGQYYRSYLYSERGLQDVTYFIMFNLQAIHLAIDDVQKYIAHKQAEVRQSVALLRKVPGLNSRQRELIVNALKKPDRVFTIYGHQQIHQISYQTARNDLFGLAQKKLLLISKSGKTFQFIPSEGMAELLKAGQ